MGGIEKTIAATFERMAERLQMDAYGACPRIALMCMGSEHGEENAMAAAKMAVAQGVVNVYYIGTLKAAGITTVYAENDEDGYKKMEALLESGEVDGAVTMHYPFPIGVSTVGRVITPARGRQMFIACTTGTSSLDRIESMVKNAIGGIITAKTVGIKEPTVGILNIDGAHQAETALNKLRQGGYPFRWADSVRMDGSSFMRGNDVLCGTPDIMVMDSLTGNVIVKMLSAYTSGGSYETVGYGYGPGVGKDYDKLVLIVSRASGTPVIVGALEYAALLASGGFKSIARDEFEKAEQAGLSELLRGRTATPKTPDENQIMPPPAEPCVASIAGIEIMDLDDAARALWREGIYAETGMGCTGPLVMVSEQSLERALSVLRDASYLS